MNRFSRTSGFKLCLVAGLAVLAATLGGCPSSVITGTLTGTITATPAATVDKTVELTVTVVGGTAPYTFAWSQVSGPSVTLASATANPATFVPQAAGIYTFAVTVTDSATLTNTGVANVEVGVGDIQFNLPTSGSFAGSVLIPGNPALVTYTARGDLLDLEPRVTVFDPLYTDDQNTQMTVSYELVSVPAGARTQDVSLDREFDTLSNQGTGDADYAWDNYPTLDAVLGITVRPNPDATFTTLTNLASTFSANGTFVPGDYVFRATVTNLAGVQRTRDLTVSLEVENIGGWAGATALIGNSAGPATYAVKTLPTGSPGNVTNKVMTPLQTATMVVTVYPSTTTSYRFYLLDNNNVPHPEYVGQSAETLVATTGPQDITLTIGAAAGLPTATYRLAFETFDGLGQLTARWVEVNRPTAAVMVPPIAPTGVPVSFHVTNDYLDETTLNAALVGVTSNVPAAPTMYQGWMGNTAGTYGTANVLVDADLDGALDIATVNGATIDINTAGFVDGSTDALLHPANNGNFAAGLPMAVPNRFSMTHGLAVFNQIAAGDLNGDGFADLATSGTIGGVGTVKIFYHTGDPAQPYSEHVNQTLLITAPRYDVATYNTNTDVFTPAAEPTRALFGTAIAIADMNADGRPDLIITDPGFSTWQVLRAALPATGIAPPAANEFYQGQQGRVYVFAGGATGQLLPGRPTIYTSLLTDRRVTDGTPAVFPTNPVLSVPAFTEKEVKYTYAYTGNILDQIGWSLDAVNGAAVVGSPFAAGTGTLVGFVDIFDPVFDGETITIAITQPGGGAPVGRVYEFDDNGVITPGNAAVWGPLGLATAADARAALLQRINTDDPADERLVTAVQDPARPERILLYYRYGTIDGAPRGVTIATTMTGRNAFVGTRAFTLSADGVVYRIAGSTASGTLANPIVGTQYSAMAIGARVAIGAVNTTTTADDLAIAAGDAGDAFGVAGDGAVFLLLDGSNVFTAAVKANAGVSSLRTGGAGLGAADVAPTGVGSALDIGDLNGDGFGDVLYTEPGFDHMYLHLGAATVSATPTITFAGIHYQDALGTAPTGSSLAGTGAFLFGDITGDTQLDWVYIGGGNFGFAGFDR